MAWIWLDGIDSFEKAVRVSAWKMWQTGFPQAYLVEMMAQAGALLLGAEMDFQKDIVFTKIEDTEFLGVPEAGKRLVIEAEAENLREEGGWFRGRIFQDGQKILEGRVLLMNVGRLRPDGQGPVTFPPQLIEALRQER